MAKVAAELVLLCAAAVCELQCKAQSKALSFAQAESESAGWSWLGALQEPVLGDSEEASALQPEAPGRCGMLAPQRDAVAGFLAATHAHSAGLGTGRQTGGIRGSGLPVGRARVWWTSNTRARIALLLWDTMPPAASSHS